MPKLPLGSLRTPISPNRINSSRPLNDHGAANAMPGLRCKSTITVFDSSGHTRLKSTRFWDEMVCPDTEDACRLTVTMRVRMNQTYSAIPARLERRADRSRFVCTAGNAHVLDRKVSRTLAERRVARANAVAATAQCLPTHDREPLGLGRRGIRSWEWWNRCRSNLQAAGLRYGLERLDQVDASVKRDSTAITVCAWDHEVKKVRLIWHRIIQPPLRSQSI
jgi:hypothetical protein